MSKVLVTEAYLGDIADAIRAKNGGSATYRPGEMAAAIRAISGGYPEPAGSVSITANGAHDVKDYATAVVSVAPNLQAKSVTQNGAVTPDPGYDGLSEVTVNVSGGGGDACLSRMEAKFINDYSRNGIEGVTVTAAGEIAIEAVKAEYYGNVNGNTAMINDLGLVLLADFSQGGAAMGNALAGSIANYSAVILNGIYNKTASSSYNTSMLYHDPALNTAYWTGMKDRNTSYDCKVTFTDAQTVSLSGNRQVIIYGIP